MKQKLKLAVFIIMATIFSNNASANTDDNFWKWFSENEAMLFAFEKNQEEIFNELSAALALVNTDLTFEFGPIQPDGKREFVISAAGIKSSFPAVEALYNKAPTLKKWIWVKYRPRRASISDIQLGNIKTQAKNVRYVLLKGEQKPGVILFFEGLTDENKTDYAQIGYLYLDEALGEFAVEMQVGAIMFQSNESKYFPEASPFNDIPSHFDEYILRSAP
jgi:hypothetical protein